MRRAQLLLPLPFVLAAGLAGCGGTRRESLPACLNDAGFLVQGSEMRVSGQAPSGATFAARVRGSRVAIDDAGNPGGARLTRKERAVIRRCAAGTLSAPAAR